VAVTEAIAAGKPFMGICLGLQLLFEESEEFGPVRGLGVLPGKVVRFFPDGAPAGIKIPHMGWNALRLAAPTPVLAGIPEGEYVYFVHSYYIAPTDPTIVATTTDFGGQPFASAVATGNLFACQFHPEKSGAMGLQMLKNFGVMG
jgi:glutamine amidotransferase